MIRNDEDFFASVGRQQEPLTNEDRKALQGMLSSTPFLKLANILLLTTDEMKNRFLNFNLGDERERAAASKLQGEIAAYPRIFGLMVDEALKKEEQGNETASSSTDPSRA